MSGSLFRFSYWFTVAIAGGFFLTPSRQGNIYNFSCIPVLLSACHPLKATWQTAATTLWMAGDVLTASLPVLWHLPALDGSWISIKTLTVWHRFKVWIIMFCGLTTPTQAAKKTLVHWILPCLGLGKTAATDYLCGWMPPFAVPDNKAWSLPSEALKVFPCTAIVYWDLGYRNRFTGLGK